MVFRGSIAEQPSRKSLSNNYALKSAVIRQERGYCDGAKACPCYPTNFSRVTQKPLSVKERLRCQGKELPTIYDGLVQISSYLIVRPFSTSPFGCVHSQGSPAGPRPYGQVNRITLHSRSVNSSASLSKKPRWGSG